MLGFAVFWRNKWKVDDARWRVRMDGAVLVFESESDFVDPESDSD